MPKLVSKRNALREELTQISWVVNRLKAETCEERVRPQIDAKMQQIYALEVEVRTLETRLETALPELTKALAKQRELEQALVVHDHRNDVDRLVKLVKQASAEDVGALLKQLGV